MSEIVCSAVEKRYGATSVISDFNLDIGDHEFVVFLGPSGCGKSTLLRMIAGLEEISGGEIRIGGQAVNDLEPRERGIAMVFQNYALYPHMTIFDNIAFGLRRLATPKNEIEGRVASVAEMLGLHPYLARKPSELSGGQQQRVAIARAIIKTPKVFLFDEPLSNLDAQLRHHMRVEIAKLHQSLRTTTVYVTHDQLEAMTLADKIVLMRGGKIEQAASPEEIYQRPATKFAASFIGAPAMNFIDVVAKRDGANWLLETGHQDFVVSDNYYNLSDGQRAILGMRPVDLKIGAVTGDIRFEGVAAMVEFHGNDRLVTLPFGRGEINVVVPAYPRIVAGDSVSVSVSAAALHLFDTESGKSLARSADSRALPGIDESIVR